jgi:hypothetical protein
MCGRIEIWTPEESELFSAYPDGATLGGPLHITDQGMLGGTRAAREQETKEKQILLPHP